MRTHILALLVLATGCGSRSGVLSADSAPASGGSAGTGSGGAAGLGGSGAFAGTSGSGASAGSAGSGGSTTTCPGFDLTGDPVGFTASAGLVRKAPTLSQVSGGAVAVIAPEIPSESPGPPVHHLRMTTLSPWANWPSSLGTGAQSVFVAGVDQFAVDAGLASGKLAMTWPAAPSPPASQPQGLFFSAGVSANGGSFDQVQSLALPGLPSHVSRFVRAGAGAYLVGFETKGFDRSFHLNYVGAGTSFPSSHIGCASSPVTGDAISMPGGGFMFAFSTSRQWGSCLDDFGVNGPADRILAGFLGGPGGGFGPLPLSIQMPFDVVSFLRLLPAPDGAWLIYRYAGINAEVQPPAMLLRLDSSGVPLGNAVPIVDSSYSGVPGLASLGERVAVATIDTSDPFGITLELRIFDSSGNVLHQRAYQPSGAFAQQRLALLASPTADQLLLGWSSSEPNGDLLRAQVARFCVPGP